MKYTLSTTIVVISLLAISQAAGAQDSVVPEPFRGFDEESKYVIGYDDLTAVLRTVVVDVGRSSREVAAPTRATTGTCLTSPRSRTSRDHPGWYSAPRRGDSRHPAGVRSPQPRSTGVSTSTAVKI